MVPQTQYTECGGVSVAYQVAGDGSIDLMFLPGFISQVEHAWEEPALRRFFERLMRFARLILFDQRGTGLSDRLNEHFDPHHEMDDALAVLDAVGSERAALMGYGSGGATSALLAARHPERIGALVMYAAIARSTAAPGYEWTHTAEERRAFVEEIVANWGDATNVDVFAPSKAADERFRAWYARLQRLAAAPGTIRRLFEGTAQMDVREELPVISVPTLVLHRTGDRAIDIRHSRYIASAIPDARYVELEGDDSFPWVGDSDAVVDEIEEFLTGGRPRTQRERTLLTVMFTDVVDATGHARRLGDLGWRDLLASHDAVVRAEIDRFEGREVKTIGDSFLAVFAGPPSQALRCARAIVQAVRALGIEVRIGMHTGECELIGNDVGGMAVHIGARVQGLAGPSEVLLSGTAFGTVVGGGFNFEHRGMHKLKGVPGEWPLFVLK